jgi:hypothetical protein
MTGHQMVVAIQTLLLCSVFCPSRMMLLKNAEIIDWQASTLAMVMTLSATAMTYAPLLTAEALFIPLLIWCIYFYDCWLNAGQKKHAVLCGVFLGLMLLTKDTGWVVWGAMGVGWLCQFVFQGNTMISLPLREGLGERNMEGASSILQNFFFLIIIPLFFVAAWQLYSIAILHQNVELPIWDFNNGLARFNFIKNGVVYIIYAGIPLTGLVFLIAGVSKQKAFWADGFNCFAFLCVMGIIFYTALTTPIIVEKKLNYSTNRMLEPFLMLPFIVMLRLPRNVIKECATNGLLIFFCMMVFGYPYALKPDFVSGMGYWSQSLANPNLGIIRNVLYLLLLCVPVIMVWWKPRWFVLSLAGVAALISLANLSHNQQFWLNDEDENMRFVAVNGFLQNAAIKKADAIYVDYQCDVKKDNDLAHMVRCFDLSKTMYFIPRLAQVKTSQDIKNLSLEDGKNVLFASSTNDVAWGATAVQMGLAKFRKITKSDIQQMQEMPLVSITQFEKLGMYINVPMQGVMERVTALASNATLHIHSDAKGCAEMVVPMAGQGSEVKVDGVLNDKPLKKISFKSLQTMSVPEHFILPMPLQEGSNTLKLNFQDGYNLLMFGRPEFKPCSMMRQ